jgi:hypothetical protein
MSLLLLTERIFCVDDSLIHQLLAERQSGKVELFVSADAA